MRWLFRLVVVAIAATSATAAEAGIPFPCFSSRIIKVEDLPNARTPQGQQYHLGYLFDGCTPRKWVGYVGHSKRFYVDLELGAVDAMVANGMLLRKPEAPGFWWAAITHPIVFMNELILSLVGALGVIGTLLATIGQAAASMAPAQATASARKATARVQ